MDSSRSLDQIIRDFVILEFIARLRIEELARVRSNIEGEALHTRHRKRAILRWFLVSPLWRAKVFLICDETGPILYPPPWADCRLLSIPVLLSGPWWPSLLHFKISTPAGVIIPPPILIQKVELAFVRDGTQSTLVRCCLPFSFWVLLEVLQLQYPTIYNLTTWSSLRNFQSTPTSSCVNATIPMFHLVRCVLRMYPISVIFSHYMNYYKYASCEFDKR